MGGDYTPNAGWNPPMIQIRPIRPREISEVKLIILGAACCIYGWERVSSSRVDDGELIGPAQGSGRLSNHSGSISNNPLITSFVRAMNRL